MGELTRNYDWSQTSIGTPDQWPQSLRTVLGIILNSKFPMFLWWGDDLVQFYNDAYRPSLGNEGKHPAALGQKGEDCWPEIWPVIKPLMDQVLEGGEATWSEDQLIPIYRNGRLEDVYWTFSYSPVNNERGAVGGVLVVCTESTEKVNNVKQLEESRQNLSFAIEAAELATWDFNPATNEFTADGRYTEWFGLSAKEATDNNLSLAIIAAEDRERVVQALRHSLDPTSGGRFDIEYTIRPKNRPEKILRAKGKATFDDNNIACRLTGTLQNVTEQVLSRKRVEESEHLFRSLIEEAPIATAFYTGPEATIRYANDLMIGYWGKDASVIGKPIREALPELENQHFPALLANVYSSGQTYTGTKERAELMVNGHLQTYYFNFTYKPLRNKDGKIYGIHHTAIDVTQEVWGQRQLEESENNLRNLILKAPVAMCIFRGPNYIVEIVNDRMLESWDKTQKEVLNKPIEEALPEAMGQGFEDLLDKVYTTGETVTAFGVPAIFTRNGVRETRYVTLVYEALREADGNISGIMIVNIDVTAQVLARKKTEESEAELQKRVDERTAELANANTELKRSNANLEEFAYAASHDMKEPIRKIHFFADRLKETLGNSLDEQQRHYFERMESSTKRMSTLIDDLLLYSHISRSTIHDEPVDLNFILALVIEDLELSIQETRARINIGLLPTVKGHRRQLQQLFENLLGNALKYSKPGQVPEITITSVLTETGTPPMELPGLNGGHTYHVIEVTDNGIGFEQQDAERIFNVFTRLHGNTEYRGTGVGLSIVRKIVESHGGGIVAESQPGQGARFKIYLPAL